MRAPSQHYDREILAGLFVILGIFIIGIFSMKITDSPIFRPGTEYILYLNDANGIFKNSKVKVAGINIGIVKKVELKEGQARLTILIDRGYQIEKGSYILPKSQGILGDRFLEVIQPKDSEAAQELNNNGAQPLVPNPDELEGDSQSQQSSRLNFEKLISFILPVAYAVEAYQEGEIIPAKPGSATADDVMRKLGDIGDDVKVLAKELKEIVKENRTDLKAAISGIRRSADHLDLILSDLSEKETRQDLKQAIRGLRESVDNIKIIAEKLNSGEGSIGKLLNDPQAADQLVRALNSIVEFLDRARRTEIIVDMSSNYLTGYKKTKTYFNLMILPRSSYGYMIGATQDPGGREKKTTTITTTNGGTPTTTETKTYDKSAFKLNVQFMRRVFNTTFRLGLFESSGGFGLDQELWKDHLSITAEAFDFGREDENAHVRLFAKFRFLDAFYIQGGYDELAAKSGTNRKNSLFVGLGLNFNDNDLKNFLLFFGFP